MVEKVKISKIEKLDDFDDEYVYDIGIQGDTPYFFANNILVHNSVYFSAYPILKEKIESNKIKWSKDIAIELYDQLAEAVNESFVEFMKTAFNCPHEYGKIIAAGREVVGERALFVKKKRYAVLITDNEGKREDIDKPGKLKAMGFDLKRADTPVFVQEFLEEVLLKVLTGVPKDDIVQYIKEFKNEFHALQPWEKGTPKRVNNLTRYVTLEENTGKSNMPGHVRAAMNWNNLCKMYNDNYSIKIADGMKTIFCKLRDNPMGYTSVSYPIDQAHLPDWYKNLPFDEDAMEDIVVDQKIENLLWVLNWDLRALTDTRTTFNDIFSFE